MRFPLAVAVGAFAALAALTIGGPVPLAQAQDQNTKLPNFAQALAARDKAFAILEDQVKGGVEEPPMAMLGAPDLDSWLFSRYRSITEDGTLSPQQRERLIAGTVHQDLQLAEGGLASNHGLARKKALRVATIANLYAAMLPADPRLGASLYEGFLLPNIALAPEKGWGAQGALLEGASAAYRTIGRADQQIQTLRNLFDLQTGRSNVAGADMARIHLSDAFEGQGQFAEAIGQLEAITTPDLLGAKNRLGALRLKDYEQRLALWNEQQAAIAARRVALNEARRAARLAREANAQAPNLTDNGTDNGDVIGADVAGALARPELPPGGFGVIARGGRRFAQNFGGLNNAGEAGNTETGEGEAGEGEGEALEGESEKMRRVRLAAEAAQVAKALTQEANELSTLALAKMLDAADAQRALETAETGGAAVPRRGARLNDNTAAPDLFALRRTAEKSAREASEAAGDAKRATLAAQQASEEAAKLALRVFVVDHDAPAEGAAVAPATTAPATTAPATTAPATTAPAT